MDREIVIVGAGQAGFQAAASLRDNGFDGRIRLVGDEPDPPYERPPLSKSYLTQTKDRTALHLRPSKFYESKQIDLILDERAHQLDRSNRKVVLRSGRRLPYDHLILATGATNRRLPIDSDPDGVLYLRTLHQAETLRERLAAAQDIVIIGAGFVGLELAATLRGLGKLVHVLDLMPRVISRAITVAMSNFLADAHRSWGNHILTGVSIAEIMTRGPTVAGVRVSDGRSFPADLVLIGIGIEPNSELARDAGLPVRNGIVVDAQLRTSDPAISAIGDCAEFPCCHSGTHLRLESVQNAVDQARCVAGRLVGKPAAYTAVPWFWSDQGDLKLQMVGITAGCDDAIIRGDVSRRSFSVFCFDNGVFRGIESVNAPSDHMVGRRLLAAGATLSVDQAGDEGLDLKAHLKTSLAQLHNSAVTASKPTPLLEGSE